MGMLLGAKQRSCLDQVQKLPSEGVISTFVCGCCCLKFEFGKLGSWLVGCFVSQLFQSSKVLIRTPDTDWSGT